MVGAVVVRKVSKGFYGRYGPTRNFYSLLAPARTHYGQLPETCWGQIALRSHPIATFGAIFAAVPSIAQISLFLNFPPPFPLTAYDGIAGFVTPPWPQTDHYASSCPAIVFATSVTARTIDAWHEWAASSLHNWDWITACLERLSI
tara:strand:+ start:7140 stop:7577 length:438 start_codon:yes stop_codon:yes gene_type:complete